MSARTQQVACEFRTTSAPIVLASHSPVVATSGQTHTRTFPVVAAAGKGPFTSYPPENSDDDDDEQLLYTYASFHEEPVAALSVNLLHNDTWTLCVPVPLPPDDDDTTLLSLQYMIKYATTCDNGNSTIQTDTILTTRELPEGVVTEPTALAVYKSGTGYAPRMVDHAAALCLSTTLAVKGNGGGEQWSHYVDNQHITPNVRVHNESQLYVVFHVCEYPTVKTIRSLAIEVSATWQKKEVEQNAKEEAERKASEEAKEKAEEKAERRAREEEERRARQEERQARAEERQARAEEKVARDEGRRAAVRAKAPETADDTIQAKIMDVMDKLKLGKCSNGYAFKLTSDGYVCGGGSHKVTFEQLGML